MSTLRWIAPLAVALVLAACLPAAPPVTLLGEADAEAYAAEVDQIVEDTLQAINDGDYEAHIQHLDETMRAATTEDAFAGLVDLLMERVGPYRSRTLDRVYDQGDFRVVIYNAEFERDTVTVRVVFWKDDLERGISGLWFDSPKLRG
ncbi:MAG: hypothetical protein Kow00124_31350 [Anaerolineae bacterium]